MDIIKGLDTFRPRLLILEHVQGLVNRRKEEFKAPDDSLNTPLSLQQKRNESTDSVVGDGFSTPESRIPALAFRV